MTEPNLFDIHPAEAAWYAAIAGHKTWHDAAETAMKLLAESKEPFSADNLRELLAAVEDPPHKNAIGGLFLSWSKQGLIRRVGGGRSTAAKRNGGHRHEWVGV